MLTEPGRDGSDSRERVDPDVLGKPDSADDALAAQRDTIEELAGVEEFGEPVPSDRELLEHRQLILGARDDHRPGLGSPEAGLLSQRQPPRPSGQGDIEGHPGLH